MTGVPYGAGVSLYKYKSKSPPAGLVKLARKLFPPVNLNLLAQARRSVAVGPRLAVPVIPTTKGTLADSTAASGLIMPYPSNRSLLAGKVFGPLAALCNVGLLLVFSRLELDSVVVAHKSIFTSLECWLELKSQLVPLCWSASITSAAQPAANGLAIEVPLMLK